MHILQFLFTDFVKVSLQDSSPDIFLTISVFTVHLHLQPSRIWPSFSFIGSLELIHYKLFF